MSRKTQTILLIVALFAGFFFLWKRRGAIGALADLKKATPPKVNGIFTPGGVAGYGYAPQPTTVVVNTGAAPEGEAPLEEMPQEEMTPGPSSQGPQPLNPLDQVMQRYPGVPTTVALNSEVFRMN